MFLFSNKKAFLCAFVYFTMLSILIVYVFGPVFHVSRTMGGGQHDGYLELAVNMARGDGYVFEPGGAAVIHRPPAYVIALIPGVYLPYKLQRIYIILLNSALCAGTTIILRKMAVLMSGKHVIAVVAMVLLGSNPWVIWSIKNPIAVILQLFLYLLLVYLAMHFVQITVYQSRWRVFANAALLGVVGAVASLSHGVMLPISLLAIFWVAFCVLRSNAHHKLPAVIMSMVIMCCLISPWTLRNYKVTGKFIPVVGNSGIAYFGGNAYWGITQPPVQVGENIFQATLRHAGVSRSYESVFHFWGLKDPAIDQQIELKMVAHIKSNPLPFLKKIILNGIGFYIPIAHHLIMPQKEGDNKPDGRGGGLGPRVFEPWLISIYYGVLLILSATAVFLVKRSSLGSKGVWFLIALSGLYAFPYFPFLTFVGHSHYVFGTLPFIYILVADLLVRRYSENRWRIDAEIR